MQPQQAPAGAPAAQQAKAAPAAQPSKQPEPQPVVTKPVVTKPVSAQESRPAKSYDEHLAREGDATRDAAAKIMEQLKRGEITEQEKDKRGVELLEDHMRRAAPEAYREQQRHDERQPAQMAAAAGGSGNEPPMSDEEFAAQFEAGMYEEEKPKPREEPAQEAPPEKPPAPPPVAAMPEPEEEPERRKESEPQKLNVITDKHGVQYDVEREGPVFEVYKSGKSDAAREHVGTAVMEDDKPIVNAILVGEDFQKRGIASALYKHIENAIGQPLQPSPTQTKAGKALWQSRQREAEAHVPAQPAPVPDVAVDEGRRAPEQAGAAQGAADSGVGRAGESAEPIFSKATALEDDRLSPEDRAEIARMTGAQTKTTQPDLLTEGKLEGPNRDEALEYRRRKLHARTSKEMAQYASPEESLTADQQRKDEDYAERSERLKARQAEKDKERAAYRQQRDEDYVAKQDARDEKAIERNKQRADKESERQDRLAEKAEERAARRQERDEDYAARQDARQERLEQKEEARQEKLEEKEKERAGRQQMRDEDYVARRDKRDQKEAAREAERNKPFDPHQEAQEQHQKLLQKERVKAAYEEQYGGKREKSVMEVALDTAQAMRGTLGGTFGALTGSILDVVAAVRKAQPEPKSALRLQAEQLNGEARRPRAEAAEEKPPLAIPAEGVPTATRVEDMPIATRAEDLSEDEKKKKDAMATAASALNKAAARKNPAKSEASEPAKAPKPAEAPAAEAAAAPEAEAAGAAGGAAEGAAGGAAEAGAGAAGGAAAAAGPAVAAVVAVYVAVIEASKAIKAAMQEEAHTIGEVTASLATLKDAAARLDDLGDAAKSASDTLIWLNPPLGIMTGVVGQATKELAALDRAVKGTAERLSAYSGPLASQSAIQEVRDMIRDINRAQTMGGDIFAANEARFRMEQKMQDISDRFLPLAMKISEWLFDRGTSSLTVMEDGIKAALKGLAQLVEILWEIYRTLPGVPDITAQCRTIATILMTAAADNAAANGDLLWQNFLSMAPTPGATAAVPNPMIPLPV